MSTLAAWALEAPEHRVGIAIGATVPFDAVDDSGTYICNWSGHLLRVPGAGLMSGRQPSFNIVGAEPLLVTKISDNAYISVNQARGEAGKLGLEVNF